MTAVKKVTDIVAEIAAASREQSAGIEQVNKAVMQMDEATQQNAALVEEAAAASQAIVEQAQALNAMVAHYNVGESERPARREPAAARRAPRARRRPWSRGAGDARGGRRDAQQGRGRRRRGMERVLNASGSQEPESWNLLTALDVLAREAEASRTSQYLTFVCAGEEYGVEILRVQEIKGWDGVTRVPYTPPYLLGVMNLRGVIVPVIDLRLRFGLPARAADGSTVVIVVRVRSTRAAKDRGHRGRRRVRGLQRRARRHQADAGARRAADERLRARPRHRRRQDGHAARHRPSRESPASTTRRGDPTA